MLAALRACCQRLQVYVFSTLLRHCIQDDAVSRQETSMLRSSQAKISREQHTQAATPARQASLQAGFTDHRAGGVTVQRLAQLARHSQQATQLRQLQQAMDNSVQRQVIEEEPRQHKAHPAASPEEEKLQVQGKFATSPSAPRQDQTTALNHTGLPNQLKSGIESLSGLSLDKVRVHYNSSQPAQLNALAYAQGTDIHVAPGQEKHLPHEAWHVVQQAQGRVKPTRQMKGGVPFNDDAGLEHEADVMGAKASQLRTVPGVSMRRVSAPAFTAQGTVTLQRVTDQAVTDAEAECNANYVAAVKRYSHGWKKKSNQSRVQILNSVRDHQATWTAVRDHVMRGGGGAPPTGYHSKALGAGATSVGVGPTNPVGIGPNTVYKQWTKQRGQLANNKLKISTFFPNSWNEAKITACVLLSFGPQAHQMTDQLALDSPGNATFYPNSALADPPQPAP